MEKIQRELARWGVEGAVCKICFLSTEWKDIKETTRDKPEPCVCTRACVTVCVLCVYV